MRAGVEIVIANMCLRQTKQKKVRLMKVVPRCAARACVRACVFLSLMSQREVQPTPPHPRPNKNNGMLSTVMQIQFNWLFVYMLHSAARGRSLTPLSKKIG